MRVAEAFPSIQEVQASTRQMYTGILDLINDNQDAIALFVKSPEGVISLVDGVQRYSNRRKHDYRLYRKTYGF